MRLHAESHDGASRSDGDGHPGVWRAFAGALVVFSVLAALWAFPLVLHLNSRFLGGPSDASSTVRDMWALHHLGKSPFTARHDPLISAPEGVSLAPGTSVANAVQPVFILSLQHLVGLVGAWNLFVLVGIALTGATTFALLTMLGLRPFASFFGAYAFSFSGYSVNKAYAGHAGLVHAWVFPLLLMALLRARTGRRAAWWFAAGAAWGLAFYVDTYYGAFAAVLVAVFVVVDVVQTRRATTRTAMLRGPAVAVGALALCLAPTFAALHLLGGRGLGAVSHPVASIGRYGARLPAYLLPTVQSPLGRLIPRRLEAYVAVSAEPSLFFGYSTLALAAGWLVWGRRNSRIAGSARFVTVFAAALTVAALCFSLPRILALGPVHVPTPSWFTTQLSTAIRVYARFGVLVGLGLAILAALAVDRLERARGRGLAIALVVLLALELTPSLPAKTWDATHVPAADRWLAEHPGGIVATYPLFGTTDAESALMAEEYYFERFHAHPLFAGVSPEALRVIAEHFSSPWTAHLLAAEHVRYVVIRTDVYASTGERAPRLGLPDFRLVARVRDARIYRVAASPLDLAAFARTHGTELAAAAGQQVPADHFDFGFYAAEAFKYATPWRWLQQDGRITITPTQGTTKMLFSTLAFANGTPRSIALYGPDNRLLGTAQVGTAMTPVTIGPFAVRDSASTFTLRASPGPQVLGGTDSRVASVFMNQPAFKPVLPAGSLFSAG